MAWETVEVFVTLNATGTPLPGVLVRFFDSTGASIFTEATSDSAGKVSVLLPVGTYTARFYKFAHSFAQPQVLEVIEDGVNGFNARGLAITPPVSSDPRLCRCSGYFRDLDGAPKRYLDMHFKAEFNPVILEGAGVIGDLVALRTDGDGWAQIDLIRGGKYQVTVEAVGIDRCVLAPDSSSANLPDVLFAVVERVLFEHSGGVSEMTELALVVGEEVDVTPTVLASSGVQLPGTAHNDVRWKLSDTSIATLVVKENVLTITGLVAGSTTLTAERTDQSIIRIPNTPIVGQPVQVTVT